MFGGLPEPEVGVQRLELGFESPAFWRSELRLGSKAIPDLA